MESSFPSRILFLLLSLLLSTGVRAELRWFWEDAFAADERQKLTAWLTATHEALERYAGPLPFDVELHLHRRDGSGEPVPWAHTRRDGRQALYFYVDTRYSLEQFMADWTAAHEMSHLLLPYLGTRHAWFAEGFASYLQDTVLVETGVIDLAEARRRRDGKMRRATDVLGENTRPFPDSAAELRARRSYPTMYWGGAVYFERVDAQLREQGGLQGVLRSYVACCRMRRHTLDELAGVLDQLSETTLFSDELENMRRTPGIPERMPG